MNTAIAYLVSVFFFGFFGVAVSVVIGLAGIQLAAVKVGKQATWAFVGAMVGAMVTYWLGAAFFAWLGVRYTWYAYLLSMVSTVLSTGARAAPDGPEAIGIGSSMAQGTMLGIIVALVIHFSS